MHTHHIIPTLALVRRGSTKQKPARPIDLHRIDCKSDHPAVILATLPTFPEESDDLGPVPSAVWEGSPRPRAVDGKGKPQTRGVRANAAVTLMLLANLMRWSTPPTRWVLRGVAIGWKGSRRKI